MNSKTIGLNKIEGLFKTISKIRGRIRGKLISKDAFLNDLNKTKTFLTREDLRKFLKSYFLKNSINIRDKEVDVLIRGMDCDRFDHY